MATKEVAVVILASDTDFDKYVALEQAGMMIGGELGGAVLDAIMPLASKIAGRAGVDE